MALGKSPTDQKPHKKRKGNFKDKPHSKTKREIRSKQSNKLISESKKNLDELSEKISTTFKSIYKISPDASLQIFKEGW